MYRKRTKLYFSITVINIRWIVCYGHTKPHVNNVGHLYVQMYREGNDVTNLRT